MRERCGGFLSSALNYEKGWYWMAYNNSKQHLFKAGRRESLCDRGCVIEGDTLIKNSKQPKCFFCLNLAKGKK